MPANLSPEYMAAEEQLRNTRTQAEKILALERMLATIPKHKGTEKLQADIKRRLSQARKESQKKGEAHAVPFYLVRKEGAGQVVLLGPPNAGKSQLVASLTRARREVAAYPFTTRTPLPGMMNYENVQIQLVDLPPISPDFTEAWMPQAIRNADAGVLVVDGNDPDVLDAIEFIRGRLAEWRMPPAKMLVMNKADLPDADENFAVLSGLYGDTCRLIAVSALTGKHLDGFARAVFEALNLVRVYTKPPGKKADFSTPYVLHCGETVHDAARHVHKDFAEHLKFARLYRASGDRDGQMVERSYVVEDGDILEFHL
jgi:small GTP-binding protein